MASLTSALVTSVYCWRASCWLAERLLMSNSPSLAIVSQGTAGPIHCASVASRKKRTDRNEERDAEPKWWGCISQEPTVARWKLRGSEGRRTNTSPVQRKGRTLEPLCGRGTAGQATPQIRG